MERALCFPVMIQISLYSEWTDSEVHKADDRWNMRRRPELCLRKAGSGALRNLNMHLKQLEKRISTQPRGNRTPQD
jgi:hypothetical protein